MNKAENGFLLFTLITASACSTPEAIDSPPDSPVPSVTAPATDAPPATQDLATYYPEPMQTLLVYDATSDAQQTPDYESFFHSYPSGEEKVALAGELDFPLKGECTMNTGFLFAYVDMDTRQSIDSHLAVDLIQSEGSSVFSVHEAEVAFAGWTINGGGNTVIIEWPVKTSSGETLYISAHYLHLKEIVVSEGDIVKSQTTLGALGNTGNSSGPHLHFSLWLSAYSLSHDPEGIEHKKSLRDSSVGIQTRYNASAIDPIQVYQGIPCH